MARASDAAYAGNIIRTAPITMKTIP